MKIHLASHAAQKPSVLVYSGPGSGTRSVQSTLQSLQKALCPESICIDTVTTDRLLDGESNFLIESNCKLFIMPGGADLPYCAYLHGSGNASIRQFIEQGGGYLGLCAGAYYACRRVEFEIGTPLEVQGDRELCLFDLVAKGSAFKRFDYESECGAVAAMVKFKSSLNGWTTCRDYVNGGPLFHLPPVDTPSVGMTGGKAIDDPASLLRYISESELEPGHSSMFNIKILAMYPELDNAVAAMMCKVGHGRAVLCSSHPELSSSWLAAHIKQDSDGGDNVRQLQCKLERCEEERFEYWKQLLVAAGMGEFIH